MTRRRPSELLMPLPAAETILPAEFPHFLHHLDGLFQNLPDAMPIGDKYSAFLRFTLDPELVEDKLVMVYCQLKSVVL